MKKSVYIETSIFSFYYDERTSPAIIAMHDWTRQWWDGRSDSFELITSVAVLGELEIGTFPHRNDALAMALKLPAISVEDEIKEVVEVYIKHSVMPNNPVGDALHLALASYHKLDYLLTWNCRHLANANKFDNIRRINTLLGLHIPLLTTPLELMGGE